jgi:uncharacterized membrane protein
VCLEIDGLVKSIVWLLVACISQAFGNALISMGMKEIGGTLELARWAEILTSAALQPEIWLGVAFMLGFFVIFTQILSWTALSLALPIISFEIVLNVACANWILGEEVSMVRWIGTALVAAGAGLVATTARPVDFHHGASEPTVR